MIRPTTPDDTPILLALAAETGVFKPLEIQALDEVLHDYHVMNKQLGHHCATDADANDIRGFVYFAPAAMTEGTWYLYWIAVAKSLHGRGLGGELLAFAEAQVRRVGGRQLLIETSSLDHYLPTRSFYLRRGYDQIAVLGDYYAAGDSMVVFAKRF